MTLKQSRRLFWMLLLLQLGGCSVFGADEEKPISLVTYSLVATETVNPNISGAATPFELQVFELEDDSMFLSADYDQLVNDAEKAIKSNYIDHRDFVLLPGQFKFIDPFEVDKNTSYIGVMARYANIENSDWKKVIKLEPRGKKYHLLLYFNANQVKLDKVE